MFAADYPPVADWAATAWSSVTGRVSGPPEVVVIDESGTRSQAVAAIYLSKAVADAAKGCKLYRWVDPDVSGPSVAEVQWAVDVAVAGKIPGRCVVIRRGTRISIVAVPATPEAMIALLKKYGA
jgi:hypothetical protein